MKLKVDDSKKFLVVTESTQLEYEQLESSFTKKVMNWGAIRSKNSHQPKSFETKFVDRYGRVPIGLWREVQKLAKKYFFHLDIEGIEWLYDQFYDESQFIEWVNTYFEESEKQPRDYQVEGISRILKYRNCTEEISTSGGKTLMAFLLFRYLFEKGIVKKMLYVVPNISLVNQTEEEFYQYEENCGKKPIWKSQCVFGGHGKNEDEKANIIFGTFQSLSKKDLVYFSKFDAVFIDECLHPDTLILMEDFSKKKIKDIKIGENVWTINEKTNLLELKEIEFVYKNLSRDQQMYEIEMENGNIIQITGNHQVLIQNNVWKRVDELNEKDEIISIDMMNI